LINALGTCASPFDCWLVLRGIETLPVRMRQHVENAEAVADFLDGHAAIKRVCYPGLASHPGHDIAKKQMKGFGGMVSFEHKGTTEQTRRFLTGTRIFALAESLGGVASLVEHPATMSHASMPKEFREKIGIADELVRLSIGLENADDLIADLDQALRV
jgi:cystathionine gamma-synthase